MFICIFFYKKLSWRKVSLLIILKELPDVFFIGNTTE